MSLRLRGFLKVNYSDQCDQYAYRFMIASFYPKRQLEDIALRIAQEAGCSSGRVYLADIFTKLGILNSIFRVLAESIGAIEKDAQSLWRLKANGLALLKGAENFRCAIGEICQTLQHFWAGERSENKKLNYNGANHSRKTVRKSLKWFESLGLFVLEDEKPIYSCVKGEAQFRSPDKLFTGFNLKLALQAYEALEQLLHQQLAIPRRLRTPYRMPKHAGMLSRMLYTALFGEKYRPFAKLPEGVEDSGQDCFGLIAAKARLAELSRQVEEQACMGRSRVLSELEGLRNKAIAAVQSIEKQKTFVLPW